MADIAGLTIAICDALLKLGERTTQLIQDAKSFNDDVGRLSNKVRSENTRTTMLKRLLFAPTPIYGGLSLFQNFSEDEQDEIRVSLGQAAHMLKETCELLEKHNGAREQGLSPASSSHSLSIRPTWDSSRTRTRTPSPSWLSFPKTSIMMLRWSLSDKKRLEKNLNEFSALKNDIHEYIKFLCLGTDLGINTAQHLQRLQDDESSIQLGFDTAARLQSLQLTAAATSIQPEHQTSFELPDAWTPSLRAAVPLEDRLALAEHRGRKYLQERRRCVFDGDGRVDRRTESRVDGLARLLNQPKEIGFCIPRCVGWSRFPARQGISFVFEMPDGGDGAAAKPVSLFRIVGVRDGQPGLEERFRLAHALANCISQLQLVKWVHESFRSDNVLFFPRKVEAGDGGCGDDAAEIDYSRPAVLGFEFSRPEFGLNWSESPGDDCVETNVYRHPERQGTPMVSFSKIHDIYALGVVLLEIGLWRQAITLQKDRFQYCRDPEVIREQLIKHATRKLAGKMGSRYQQVVLKCLTADFGVRNDTKEDLKLQQAFRLQVVDVLERTANSV